MSSNHHNHDKTAAGGASGSVSGVESSSSPAGLINPHVPEFMAKAPWYASANMKSNSSIDQSIEAIDKSKTKGERITTIRRFVAGACKNCGSTTHNVRDCLERPKKLTAVKAGISVVTEEIGGSGQKQLSWDAKRDKYAGFDVDKLQADKEAQFNVLEAERERVRAAAKLRAREARQKRKETEKKALLDEKQRMKWFALQGVTDLENVPSSVSSSVPDDLSVSSLSEGDGNDSFEQSDSDEDDDLDESGETKASRDAKAKFTNWNLRNREDTAKYLLNLDVNSAFFDPKSRSMRENPFPDAKPDEVTYMGDNATRTGGDMQAMAQSQIFAWDAAARQGGSAASAPTHLVANPTRTALLKKQVEERKLAVQKLKQDRILASYSKDAEADELGKKRNRSDFDES